MTAHSPVAAAAVRSADLGDARECARLDAYVREHPASELFHRPAWSQAVEAGCGQKSHYLVAEGPGGRLAGCLPLTHVRSMLFGNALVSAGFGTGGGVLADDRAAADALLGAAEALADRLGCATLELRGGPIPRGYRIVDDVYAGFAIPLSCSEAAIVKAIGRRKYDVRRGQKAGLEARFGRQPSDVADLFRVLGESMRNLGSPVFPRRLFAAMLERFGEEADILIVHRGGRPVAGLFNLYFRDTILPFWGGGTREARSCSANDFLYFEAMCHASRLGFTRFDFGRSKLGSGNAAFKRHWGAEPKPLRYGIRSADGGAPRDLNPLSSRNRLKVAAWKKLPLPIANRVGPWLARGLG